MAVALSELKEYRDLGKELDQVHTKETHNDETYDLRTSLQTSHHDENCTLAEEKDLDKERVKGRKEEELERKSELKTLNHAGKLCNIISNQW